MYNVDSEKTEEPEIQLPTSMDRRKRKGIPGKNSLTMLHDLDNYDGVITHLEPDILECEVKWALERITTKKTSGVDGIPVELFQILKMML